MIYFSCNGHHLVTKHKIASTSLKKVFENNKDFTIITKRNIMFLDYENFQKDSFSVVVRNPYERYLSGLVEVLTRAPFYTKLEHLKNIKFTTKHLEDVLKVVRKDYSFGNDTHVENWLDFVLVLICKGIDVEIIDLNDLNNWIEQKYSIQLPKVHSKPKHVLNVIDSVIKDTELFELHDYYLLSETNIYNWLTSENFKKMSLKDKQTKARDLLTETINNLFGHELLTKLHSKSLEQKLDFIKYVLKETE